MEYCHHWHTNTDDNLTFVTLVFAVLTSFGLRQLLSLVLWSAIV